MRVIFLDRDGVINEYPGDFRYVTEWREFKFLPQVKESLKRLNDAGYKIFIVSNQAGISKGVFTQDSLDEITEQMLKEIRQAGGEISGVYYCVHRDEDNCSCRKPKTGLIDMAFRSLGIKKRAFHKNDDYLFVGDTMRDIQTGKTAGCKTILVFSGKESLKNKDKWIFQPDFTATNLSEAVDLMLKI